MQQEIQHRPRPLARKTTVQSIPEVAKKAGGSFCSIMRVAGRQILETQPIAASVFRQTRITVAFLVYEHVLKPAVAELFVFGKNDFVGTLSNLFPLAVALYNLSLDFKSGKPTVD